MHPFLTGRALDYQAQPNGLAGCGWLQPDRAVPGRPKAGPLGNLAIVGYRPTGEGKRVYVSAGKGVYVAAGKRVYVAAGALQLPGCVQSV